MAEKYPGGPPSCPPQEAPPPYTPSSYPVPPSSYPPPPANYTPPPSQGAQAAGPPPGGYGPPPVGHHHTTVVVTGAPPPKVQQQPKPKRRGLMGSFLDGVESLGRQLEKEVDYCTKKVNATWAQYTTSAILNQFTTGSVVQLISRATGHCLQVVALPNGQLTINGLGSMDTQQGWNTLWTVVNEGKNQVRLHNNHNYLALVQGVTQLVHVPPGTPHGIETKFQLDQTHDNFVMLESLRETGRHVAILPDGQLKSGLAAGRDWHSHFGLKVVYSPYVAPGHATSTTTTTVVKTQHR